MMSIETVGGVEVTPELMARLFWEMASDEQVRFFAALDDAAGHVLCLQMAHVVDEISKESIKGDFRAMNAFRTMFDHAESYAEAANHRRAFMATLANDNAAREAKKGLLLGRA